MKWNEVFCHTFKELRKHIEPEVSRPSDFMLPSFPMIEACRANDFDFFLPFLDSGRLTIEDMHHAAERYHLGIVLFPDTDPDLRAYTRWYNVATEGRHKYDLDITVSPLLELRATPDQKRRKIDLVDFLFEHTEK